MWRLTGWCPQGIQQLVSTYQLPARPSILRVGWVLWTNSNPRSLNLAKLSFSGGGGSFHFQGWLYSGQTQIQSPSIWPGVHFQGLGMLNQLKPKVPISLTIFISRKGGGGIVDTTIRRGALWNFKHKILKQVYCYITDSLSRIRSMWGLNKSLQSRLITLV